MKVLVTGGAGYIGSHTAKELQRQGYTPVVMDSLVCGHQSAVKWGPFYHCDILETEKVIQVIRDEKIEVVVHFAAFSVVGDSVREPLKYYENNVLGSLSLLKAMNKTGLKKIIFSSTCATYGEPSSSPILESFVQQPLHPYGRSKLMVENILKDYVSAHQFSVTVLRYFNAAGADRDLEIGESHDPETRLIPLAIEAAHDPKKALTIYGDDYPTSDGTGVRDYIHVSDLARVHILALEHLKPNLVSCYNLGTGHGYSVKEVIDRISLVTGKKVNIKIGKRRPGDPPILVASGEKADQELKWKPVESDLSHIIETANKWYLLQR